MVRETQACTSTSLPRQYMLRLTSGLQSPCQFSSLLLHFSTIINNNSSATTSPSTLWQQNQHPLFLLFHSSLLFLLLLFLFWSGSAFFSSGFWFHSTTTSVALGPHDRSDNIICKVRCLSPATRLQKHITPEHTHIMYRFIPIPLRAAAAASAPLLLLLCCSSSSTPPCPQLFSSATTTQPHHVNNNNNNIDSNPFALCSNNKLTRFLAPSGSNDDNNNSSSSTCCPRSCLSFGSHFHAVSSLLFSLIYEPRAPRCYAQIAGWLFLVLPVLVAACSRRRLWSPTSVLFLLNHFFASALRLSSHATLLSHSIHFPQLRFWSIDSLSLSLTRVLFLSFSVFCLFSLFLLRMFLSPTLSTQISDSKKFVLTKIFNRISK